MADGAPELDDIPDPRRISTLREFGQGLRLLRERAGLTVRELARRVGMPPSSIGDYVAGIHLPRVELLPSMLLACGISDPPEVDAWLAAWRRVRRTPGRRPADAAVPYRGLRSFEPDDAAWFCGRQRLTQDIAGQLRALCEHGGLAGLVGPSGSGKSSLLRAGLIPALRAGALGVPGSAAWPVTLFTPGDRPARELAARLAALTGEIPPGGRPVVVVDQFEQAFTACQDEAERLAFITALCAAAGPGSGAGRPAALVVLGLRADFYSRVLEYPALVSALQAHQVLVGPMTEAELRQAIIEPARRAKLDVDDGLVEVLLRDLAPAAGPAAGPGGPPAAHDPGALPLLSHALLTTWERSRTGTLTVADYRATGGIRGAVAASAEEAYLSLTPGQQDLARQLFSRLVHIADGTADTRRRVPADELLPRHDDARPVLDAFIERRLITAEDGDVEIVHDALLRAWPRLRDWIDADRAGARVRRQLTTAAQVWREAGRDPSALYHGGRLAAAEDWAAGDAHGGELTALEREFLTASVARAAAEGKAARRRTRRLRQLAAALAALTVAAGLLAVAAYQQKAVAAAQRDKAVSRQVAIEAGQLRDSDAALAMQLSLAAFRIAPTAAARTSLLESTGGPPVTRLLGPAGTELHAVAYSPDRALLAAGAADGTVRLWDVSRAGQPVQAGAPLAVPAGSAVTTVAFSPVGAVLAAGSADGVISVWSLAGPRRPALLGRLRPAQAGTVNSVAFSPDGRILAAGCASGRVYLWNVNPGNAASPRRLPPLAAPLPAGGGQVGAVAFSPDGRTLVAGTSAGRLALWRLTARDAPRTDGLLPTGSGKPVNAVAFSPDGRALAAAGDADQVWLWTLAPGRRPAPRRAPLAGPASWIYAVAFSPDGASVAAGSADNNVYVWNLADGAVTATLPHPAPVLSVAYGGGGTLATGDADGTARIWALPGPLLTGPRGAVFAVACGPGGHTVAAGSGDGTLRLWDMSDPARPVALGPPMTAAGGLDGTVAYGRGGRLAAGTASGGIQLWNAADPRHPVPLPAPPTALSTAIQYVTFDPSGHLMAAASAAGTIEVWNTDDFARATPVAVIPGRGPKATREVFAVAISPGDRLLAAAGDDGTVRLWNITRPGLPVLVGRPLVKLASAVYQVTFSPDGRLLAASGEDGKVRLWQVTSPARPRLLATLAGPVGIVYDVAFSPDGRTLATADGDKTVRLWDITDPARPGSLGALTGPAGTVFSAAFSPDGRALVAGSQDGTTRIWLASPAAAARYVCSVAGTPITRAEWARFIPGMPYRPPCAGAA